MDVEIQVQTEGNPEYKVINRGRNPILFHGGDIGAAKPNGIYRGPS